MTSNAEKIARAFHDEYEAFAAVHGWETQEATRTSFDDLPPENRQTMVSTVQALLDRNVIAATPPDSEQEAGERPDLIRDPRFYDYVLDELVVIAGGRRGMTSDKVPFARWDMRAAVERALDRLRPATTSPPDRGEAAGLMVSAYWVPPLDPFFGPITIQRTGRLVNGEAEMEADVWAIRRGGSCLSRSGEWVYEPIPSSRTDDWLAEHRFTLADAIPAAKAVSQPHSKPDQGDDDCYSCGEGQPPASSSVVGEWAVDPDCPGSKRSCGHHCNCSWVHDRCCWCGKEFGEKPDQQGEGTDRG